MNWTFLRSGIAFIILLMLASAAIAQRDSQPEPPRHSCPVVMVNSTGSALHYRWNDTNSDDASTWTTEDQASSVNGGRCIGRRSSEGGSIFVVIATPVDGSLVEKRYRLEDGKRYRFFSNAQCKCWDIGELSELK